MNPHRITITGEYGFNEEQVARLRDEGLLRGLIARRSPEPDPVVFTDAWPDGWTRTYTPTRSGALERVTCPRVVGYVLTKLASEFLRYRRDRVGD